MKKISSLAGGILAGLNESIAHAKGIQVPGMKEIIIYTADAKAIREKLGMSQSEFANAYKIPLSTLKNWEQGRRTPDATASAYLFSIAKLPKEIQTAHDEHAPTHAMQA